MLRMVTGRTVAGHKGKGRTVTAGIVLVFAINLLLALTPSVPAAAASCAANAGAPMIDESSWGQQRMGAERAWPRATGEVIVAVIDTGVSARTASLRGAVLPGADVSGGRGDVDCFGRGTFVASLIAARAVEGTGFVGVAPGATILPIRVTSDPDDFTLDKTLPGLLSTAINTAVGAGARVIAMPLTTNIDDGGLRAAVRNAVTKDVLIVAAAARPDATSSFPAQLEGVLSVAPLTPDGGLDAAQLGAPPDLAAPSSDLIGAVPDGAGHIGGGGEGVAVAYAAGAAALVMDAYPELSAQQVGERLIETADGTTSGFDPDAPRDASIGYGVVNPAAAVMRLQAEAGTESLHAVTTLDLPEKPDERPANLALIIALGALVVGVAVIGPTMGIILSRRSGKL